MTTPSNEDETFAVLLQAASTGRTDMVQTLLKEYGADVSRQQEKTGSTALHLACANGYVDCVRALLRAGSPTRCRDSSGARPLDLVGNDTATAMAFQAELLQCVTSGRLDAVAELLSGGVDPNNDGLPEGSSILNWAVSFQQSREMLALLLQFGADVNQVGSRGKSALHEACQNGDADVFEYLLSVGARADVVDSDNCDPRHYLPSQDLLDQVWMLLCCTNQGVGPFVALGSGAMRLFSRCMYLRYSKYT
jgi:ankyrin repeat protein